MHCGTPEETLEEATAPEAGDERPGPGDFGFHTNNPLIGIMMSKETPQEEEEEDVSDFFLPHAAGVNRL